MSGDKTISTSETRIDALKLQSSAYGVTKAVVYGKTRVAGNLVWYGGFKATAHTSTQSAGGKGGDVSQTTTSYTYSASAIFGLGEGTITDVPRVWVGKTLYADGSTTALAQLKATLAPGWIGQGTWPYLTTNFPEQALGYSGMAYVYAQDYALNSNAGIDNHTFEVVGLFSGASVPGSPDANMADVTADILTSTRYGSNFPTAYLGDWSAWANYCKALGLVMSPALTSQMTAGEFVTAACKYTNTAPVWSGGFLKMVPYGDTAVAGNGTTYTPNVTPVYDLTDDDYICAHGTPPISVKRSAQSDAYNHVRVEYLDRATAYNTAVAEAKDAANIDTYGLRSMDVVSAHWICDAAVAQSVAQLMLQRALYVRSTYSFTLPWTKVLLEPMDLVTLTDSSLGFVKLPVRIIEISESAEGDLDVTAEDFPLGVAHAATYSNQAGGGYQHNYNVDPGSVQAPTIFEAPIELTTTGLEVYAAVAGLGQYWGGCRVWVSNDGTNYKDAGKVYGASRYGTLTAAMAAGDTSMAVQISAGQLISGSAADAAALSTLLYVGGSSPEYMAYTTATLTGSLAYTLGTLVRGAYGTTQAAHAIGAPFVRVDGALAKSGALDLAMIGKTIYFKFTSFNVYGGAEQPLDTVTAYPYTISGSMANLPPPAFDTFLVAVQPDGTRQFNFGYTSASPVDWQGAQIRYTPGTVASPDWASMQQLQDSITYYTASPVEINAPLSGTWTFACRSLDKLGNLSAAQVRTITLPDRRLGGDMFDAFDEQAEGWLGTITNARVAEGTLEVVDSTTWNTLPATWDAWTRWIVTPVLPVVYITPVRDLGIGVSGYINTALDVVGATVQEVRTSADNVTWTGWMDASNQITARYVQMRFTFTAATSGGAVVVRQLAWQVNVPHKSEYLNDVVVSGLAGVYRIGVGDVRIPLTQTFNFIKRITVVIQSNTTGAWTWSLLDKSLSPAPRVQFRLNGTLADPDKVDFITEGF